MRDGSGRRRVSSDTPTGSAIGQVRPNLDGRMSELSRLVRLQTLTWLIDG